MKNALAYVRWENIAGFSSASPVTFNSRQERLHELDGGDALWLVSRNPSNSQYYFVARLTVARRHHNPAGSPIAESYGLFGVEADVSASRFFGESFPAEGLLRALLFETGRPIKHGASVGHSLQTIRIAAPADAPILDAAYRRAAANGWRFLDRPFGLWTKCAPEFADYFLTNWQAARQPMAFLLYDSAPVLPEGAPVFVHSDKNLAFIGRFAGAQNVSAYRHTVEPEERDSERERVWHQFRENTLKAPTPADFREFWDGQDGVRSLFFFKDLLSSPHPAPFKVYGRALEWGYPNGVGYRYLAFAEAMLLLKAVGVNANSVADFASTL